MSRLKIATPNKAQLTVERLYKDLERRIIASPPGLCPVDLQLSFLKMCHAQTCGKCVPCRVGLGQLQNLMEDVLAGKATLKTLDLIRDTASDIVDSADCAIGYEAAHMVLAGLEGFREDYVYHIEHGGKCSCHITQPVPCVALCPAGVDIPGYIALVKEERYADAVKLIRKDNPFPTACALICEHPCEARCRRNMIDSAINIRGLKRMAVDNARANTVPVPEKAESTGKKVAIIGGGPGGLSAAYYLELMGHHAVVFEEKSKLGGMLRYGIPNYRFPRERLQEDIDTILSTGVEVKLNTRVGNGEGEISYNKLHEEYDAVYIAIGAHTDKKIGIEGEDANGVMSAVEMLRRIGDDDMPDFKDKTVVVVGGGTAGLEAACTAAEVGCNVFLLEKSGKLGGLSTFISDLPSKNRMKDFPKYLEARAKRLKNLYVFLNCEATVDKIKQFKPDIIVNATGSVPVVPPIKGLKENIAAGHVDTIFEMIQKVKAGEYPDDFCKGKKVVVVGGGSVGLDVVEYFAPRGAECTIVDMLPQIGMLADPITKCSMRETHDKYGVKEYVNTALQEVKENAFTVKLPDGTIEDLNFDLGFNCLGMRANNPILVQLEEAFDNTDTFIYPIGDSVRARRIMEGTMEGRAILNVLEARGFLELAPLE